VRAAATDAGRIAPTPLQRGQLGVRGIAPWWPLVALVMAAAAVRLSTLGLQSLWFDEAFTPVHVFRASLSATLSHVGKTENTPPLWYLLEWAVIQVAGNGAVALRSLSALAGIATVPVTWGIANQLAGRRAAIIAGALTAASPLFVWYSQEARAYALFVFFCALAMWCCVRADAVPSRKWLAAFAVSSALALLSHYFAVFLVVPMALWLMRRRERLLTAGLAGALIVITGAALIPLALTQGGHGAQWIGQWALASRIEAVPQYFLTGYSGAALGHAVELAVALPLVAGVFVGIWQVLDAAESRAALLALGLAACGVLLPLLLAIAGADYFAPRNLIAAMVPVTVLLAVVMSARRTGWLGMALGGVSALALLAICVDVDVKPRLQRGDWSGVARVLSAPTGDRSAAGDSAGGTAADAAPDASERVIATVHLGTAPLQYYMAGLGGVGGARSLLVREIDEVGYAPLTADASAPPAPGFQLQSMRNVNGLVVFRFVSAAPRTVAVSALTGHEITREQGQQELLVAHHAA
jgi:hypothetical protein